MRKPSTPLEEPWRTWIWWSPPPPAARPLPALPPPRRTFATRSGQALPREGGHRVWLRGVRTLQRTARPGGSHRLPASQVSCPSLNLGQAIMLYAYELGPLLDDQKVSDGRTLAENFECRAGSRAEIKNSRVAVELGVSQDEKLHQWVMDRVPMLPLGGDLNMLHLLCKTLPGLAGGFRLTAPRRASVLLTTRFVQECSSCGYSPTSSPPLLPVPPQVALGTS